MASANAAIADELTARAFAIERAKKGLISEVLEILYKTEVSIISDLGSIDPTDPTREAARRARLEKLLKSTQERIREFTAEAEKATAAKLVELAKVEVAGVRRATARAVGVDLLSVEVSSATLRALASGALIQGHPAAAWWEKAGADMAHRFEAELQIGMARGESIGELIRRVKGTQAAGFSDGILATTRATAAALVRTSAASVASAARMELYQGNGEVVKGYQWRATLDLRTSPICMALDGLAWDLNGEPLGHKEGQLGKGPPAHWSCRSTLIGLLKSWGELSRQGRIDFGDKEAKIDRLFEERLRARGFSEDKIALATRNARASMDGAVPRATTFEEWLSGRSKADQIAVLGRGKQELWEAGKIGLRDLIGPGLRPLTLAELAEL